MTTKKRSVSRKRTSPVVSKGLSGIEVRYLIWKGSVPKEPTSLVVSEGLSAIEELWKKQKEVDVLLRESREKQASMEMEAAVQDIELLSQEESPTTTTPGGRDLQLRYQSQREKYNRLKGLDRQLESAKEKIRSIPEIKNYLHPPKRVSSAPSPIAPVQGNHVWRPNPRAEENLVESKEAGVEATTTNGAEESDRGEQPVTVEDIKAALGNRIEVVELWQRRQRSLDKKDTKRHLYELAGQDPSEFYKWQRGELPDGSTADRDIRRELTTDRD